MLMKLIVCVLLGSAGPALAQYRECRASISECTSLIESGKFAGQALGQAYSDRADLYLREGRLDDALRDINRAAELSPSNNDILLKRAAIHVRRGDKSAAIVDYKKVYESTGNSSVRAELEKLGVKLPPSKAPNFGHCPLGLCL